MCCRRLLERRVMRGLRSSSPGMAVSFKWSLKPSTPRDLCALFAAELDVLLDTTLIEEEQKKQEAEREFLQRVELPQ